MGSIESNLVDISCAGLHSNTLHIVRKLKYLFIPCKCLDPPSIILTTFRASDRGLLNLSKNALLCTCHVEDVIT